MRLKDSGVDWIGKIPEGWRVMRIESLYDLRSTKVSDKDYMPLSVGKMGVVPQMESVAKTINGDDRKLVRTGDFVINSRSDRRGACGIASQDGSVSLINIVLAPRSHMDSGYYNWLFHTTMFADEFYNNGKGIVDDLWSTRWLDMKAISIPVPSIDEQKSMAAYLDKKTAAIDSRVAVLEQKLAAYKRLKASVINRAVTRGVPGWGRGNGTTETTGTNGTVATSQGLSNGGAAKGVKVGARRVPEVAEVSGVPCRGSLIDRPLRDSGVDWIGKVPAGWSVDKIGNCFDVIGSGTTPRTGSQDLYEGEIPWVQSGDLHGDWVFETSKRVNETALMNYSLPIYKAPFICVAMYGASIGNVSKIGIDACTNQACCALCKPRPEICLGFMFYLLRQSQQRLLLFAEGGTQPNINRGTITGLRVGLPPLSEQRAIADYLDAECAKIDKMAELVTREIELYKKLKRSLINEVVTGKRGVA